MPDDTLRQQLIRVVQRRLRETETAGAAVTLFVDGRPLLQAGVGFEDAAGTARLGPAAQFYIYSITKTLIAIAVLQLVEQGELALEDNVQRFLPGVPLTAAVTVRQLLNHTGGIPDYGGMDAYHQAVREQPQRPWSPEHFFERALADGLAYAPGEGWGYSNVGFLTLKRLLERVTSGSLWELLEKGIFAPLELRHTFVAETLQDGQKLTPGYSALLSDDNSLQEVTSHYHPGWVSHGVVVSTAPEVARIFEALFQPRLLKPALLEAMLTPVLLPFQHSLFRQPAYGLGVMIDPQSPYGAVAGHGGGGPGYSTAAFHFPNVAGHRLTTVALANRDQPDLGLSIAFDLADTLARLLPVDDN